MTIRLDAEALRDMLTGPHGAVLGELMRRARLVENKAKQLCPVDTGRLRSSIHHDEAVTESGEPVARVYSDVQYAMWVHEGTGIYGPRGTRIYPKNGRFLVFTPKGSSRKVFARSIAGMRGRPFLVDAMAAAAG